MFWRVRIQHLFLRNFCFLRNLLIWQLFILLYYIIAFYMDIIHNSFILFKEIMPGYFPLSNGFKQHFIQQFIKGIIIISNMCQHHFLLYLYLRRENLFPTGLCSRGAFLGLLVSSLFLHFLEEYIIIRNSFSTDNILSFLLYLY